MTSMSSAPAAFRGAQSRAQSGQSIPNSTGTYIEFNRSPVYDTDNFMDGIDDTKIWVPAGVTKIRVLVLSCGVTGAVSAGDYVQADFDINGSWEVMGGVSSSRKIPDARYTTTLDSGILEVAGGDYIQVSFTQVTGGSATFYSSSALKVEVVE